MLGALKRVIRRAPAIDRLLKRAYYDGREILERRVVGTRLQEYLWQRRDAAGVEESDTSFWLQTRDAHRDVIVAAVRRRAPIASLLEVGCGPGANLYRLGVESPAATMHGLDINGRVVDTAQARFRRMGMNNVTLAAGRGDVLPVPNRSFDVVLCDAVLMYVGPDKIDGVLRELLRVARKCVLLSEWQSREGSGSTYHYGHWIHDYVGKLRGGAARVRATRYPDASWADRSWREFGSLVEVDI